MVMFVLPVQVEDNLLSGLTSHEGVHLHQVVSNAHNLRSFHTNVLSLSLRTAHRLMDHDA